MKNPALTKVMSAALAVLCAIMIGFGITEIGDAKEVYADGIEAAENLAKKCDTYKELDALLAENPLDYERAKAGLDGLSEQYAKDSSQHKAALAEFTATKGGTTMGSLALDSAAYALQVGKKQMEDGLAEFQKQLGDYAFLIDYLPSEEDIACLMDAVEKATAEFEGWGVKLTELENSLEALREQGISEIRLSELRELIASLCGECALLEQEESELSAEREEKQLQLALVEEVTAEVTQELSAESGAAMLLAESADDEIDPGFTAPDAAAIFALVDERIMALTGKSIAEIRAEAEACEQRLCELHEKINELKRRIDEADGELANVRLTLDEVQCGIDAARACYDCAAEKLAKAKEMYDMVIMAIQGKAMLDQARAAIEEGEIEIATAWYQLKLTKDGFSDTEKELAGERDRIETDRAIITQLQRKIDDYNSLSNRWKRARNALKLYPELKESFEAGDDILAAAEELRVTMAENNEKDYKISLVIAALCIAAGAFGILTLPGSFELCKTYPYILIAGALCLLCSAGAEALGVYAGRGQTYAALAGAVFALLYLPTARPEKKKRQ